MFNIYMYWERTPLTLCADMEPLRSFRVGLGSSSLRVAMIEETRMLLSISSIIATWRDEDLRPTLKQLSGSISAQSVKG